MYITNKLNYILLFWCFTISIVSQPIDNKRNIVINNYSINDKLINFSNQEIFLSSNDSISFFYGLEVQPTAKKDAFLFKVSLKVNNDSSVINTGQNFISYKGLAEGRYKLTITAFDLQRKWNAKPYELEFDVDNTKAQLQRQLDSIKLLNEKNKSIKNNDSLEPHEAMLSINYIIGIGISLVAILIFVIIFVKRKQIGFNNQRGKIMDNKSNTIEELNLLKTENSELRAEIAELRGQIDALNARGELLNKQNKELQSNLNKLEHSKDELEELQKQKDELFAVIIHDIKNPASLIKSLVELLTSYDLTASEQQEIIQDIAQTTSKIVSLSQEVTKILSLESSTVHLNYDLIDINEVIKDVNQKNQIAAKNKSINLFTELMEKLPQGEFDHQKIDEVIDNLVSNAIKFTPNGGAIRIKSSKELNNLVVEVSDNGLGLTEEDLKQTFKRGIKLSAQPTAGESSTGLGLWIVKKLVESHNGRVWVKSTLGKGSTFAFSIPLKREK